MGILLIFAGAGCLFGGASTLGIVLVALGVFLQICLSSKTSFAAKTLTGFVLGFILGGGYK